MADLWPYGLPADQLGDLGQAIAQRYGQVATRIETRIRKLVARGVEGDAVTQLQQRLLMARELEEYVQKVIAQVPADQLAQMVTSQAAAGASATISRILADVPGLESYAGVNGTNISSAGLQAVAAIELDLRNAYTNLNQRILRDSQDIYQSITAEYASLVTAGVATRRELKREILAKYLEAGVGSYVDGRGRHWPIDVYAEMSTRTAASRAWREQSVSSMESHGVEVFSPVVGRSSCSICGPWAGKIVSRVHPGGTRLTIRNAQTGEMVQITVDASLEEMRNMGWGHPNCRCILIPATPGLGVDPENFTTRDPVAEADRAEERRLRRELQKTDDPALKRELRNDLREVRTRIDQRKTNYATRPQNTPTRPQGQAPSQTMDEYTDRIKKRGYNIDPSKMSAEVDFTEGEKHAIGVYSHVGYSDLNKVSRGTIKDPIGASWDTLGGFDQVMTDLDSALDKTRILTDSRVMRSGRWSELEQVTGFGLGGPTGYQSPWHPNRMDPSEHAEFLNSLMGKPVNLGGYTSTSVPLKSPKTTYTKAAYGPNDDVIYNVLVPEGTKGGVLGELNRRGSEREVLFPKGTTFEIIDAIIDPTTGQLRLTVTAKN